MSEEPKFDDGGPAHSTRFGNGYGQDGMTLMDWFAGQALTGIIASPGCQPDDASRIGTAELAYEFASAMIAEKRRRWAGGK